VTASIEIGANPAVGPLNLEPAQPRPSRGWVLFGAPLLAAILLGGLGVFGAVATKLGPRPSRFQIQQFLNNLPFRYDVQMGFTILVYLAVLLAIWILLPKRGPAAFQSYFQRVSWQSLVLSLLSGVVFAILIGSTLVFLSDHKFVTFHTTSGERALVPRSVGELEIGLLAIAVVGPLVEEVYFRGLFLRWLTTKMPLLLAAVPNAAVFACIHFRFSTHVGPEGWVLTAGLFVFGLFASAWAGALRSIWPAFAAHGMYNATLISVPLLADLLH
jgi:membrane protease YdiL (CAAX protease family)